MMRSLAFLVLVLIAAPSAAQTVADPPARAIDGDTIEIAGTRARVDAPGLAERWSIDPAALARKIAALPETGRIAIVETAQRFWALSHLPDSQALDLATQHPATWPHDERA